eukprot:1450882-Amphidinium_carterae.1
MIESPGARYTLLTLTNTQCNTFFSGFGLDIIAVISCHVFAYTVQTNSWQVVSTVLTQILALGGPHTAAKERK